MTEREPVARTRERAPWGFVIIVTLAVLYVVLRLVQIAGWLIDWVT